MGSFYIQFDSSGLDELGNELPALLRVYRKRVLTRALRLMSSSVDQAFLNRGYASGTAMGPSSQARESRREKVGKFAELADSTKARRAAWSKRTGKDPAGEELRLTDSLRRAATDTTGSVEGSAAYVDVDAGEAAIGVDLAVFPGGQALQWGYAPRRLPARPFLALTSTVSDQIIDDADKDLSLVGYELARQFSR